MKGGQKEEARDICGKEHNNRKAPDKNRVKRTLTKYSALFAGVLTLASCAPIPAPSTPSNVIARQQKIEIVKDAIKKNPEEAIQYIEELAAVDYPETVSALVDAAKKNPEGMMSLIEKMLASEKEGVRVAALSALEETAPAFMGAGRGRGPGIYLESYPGVMEKLGGLLTNEEMAGHTLDVVIAFRFGINWNEYPSVMEGIGKVLTSENKESLKKALKVLDEMYPYRPNLDDYPEIIERVVDLLKADDLSVREAAAQVTGRLAYENPEKVVPILKGLLKDENSARYVVAATYYAVKGGLTLDNEMEGELMKLAHLKETSKAAISMFGTAAVGDSKYLYSLTELLADKDKYVSKNAVLELDKIAALSIDLSQNEEIIKKIEAALWGADTSNYLSVIELFGTIVARNPDVMVPRLEKLLKDKGKRYTLIEVLGTAATKNPAGVSPYLENWLRNKKMKDTASEALKNATFKNAGAMVPQLKHLLDDPDKDIRWWAAGSWTAGYINSYADSEVILKLGKMLDDPEWEVKWGAAWALENAAKTADLSKYSGVMETLLKLLDDKHWELRWGASGALKGAAAKGVDLGKYPGAIEKLGELLEDKNAGVRTNAAGALKENAGDIDWNNYPGIIEKLGKLLKDKNDAVKQSDGTVVPIDEVWLNALLALEAIPKKHPEMEPSIKQMKIKAGIDW